MNENRDELRRLLDRFLACWNAEDVRGMAACWLETGDVVSTEGRLVRGREGIAALLAEERAGALGGTRASMSPTLIRSLSPGLALVDADMEIVSSRSPSGSQPLHMHVVIVVAQREDGWWFEAVRPYPLYSKATRSFGAPPPSHQTGEMTMTRAPSDAHSAFPWPPEFPRIPDRPWVHQPVDWRGLAYDAMGSHLWYRNLELTVEQLGAHLRDGHILVNYSGGTGLLEDRLLPKVPGVGVIMAEPSAAFLRAALEKLRGEERVAFRLLAFLEDAKRLEWLDEALGPAMVARGVDALVSTNACHLYTDLAGTVQGWHRSIRPGGRVFMQSAEIQNPAARPDELLITQYASKLREGAREIVQRDDRYAAYRPVLQDAARMATYEGLWRRVFPPVKPVVEYLDTLKSAGFVIEDTTSATVEVGVDEWYEASRVYPDLLAWVGGSEKAGDAAPTAAVIADRNALMSQAKDEVFGGAITFNSCWTYITCRRP